MLSECPRLSADPQVRVGVIEAGLRKDDEMILLPGRWRDEPVSSSNLRISRDDRKTIGQSVSKPPCISPF